MTRFGLALVTCVLITCSAAPLFAQEEVTPLRMADKAKLPPDIAKALDLWEDYVHYLRIAQTELSTSAGTAFLAVDLDPAQLLLVVDELSPYRDFDITLVRAQKLEGAVGDLAKKVEKKIHDARLSLAREGKRIRAAIEELDDGLRQRLLAQDRLAKAGEYAVPQMLQVLQSSTTEDRTLSPFVIETMVKIGRPVVAPLCESLDELPATTKQQVAEVLARIGYPMSLPYLKAEMEKPGVDNDTQQVLTIAFNTVLERTGIPADTTAAQLFLMLAEDFYKHRESLILDPKADFNLMWSYASGSGLSAMEIPTPIYFDAMSMRASKRALKLNPDMAAALSLWLTADFRRENNLPAGATDPSYAGMRSPHFYATLAGPDHIHPVLHRALEDMDAELALDAIRALRSTSSTRNLLNVEGSLQPLIAAMNYPDRRVRFEAAFAISESQPHVEFSGAQRVVPVLGEATREAGKLYAAVIAPSIDEINGTVTMVQSGGQYQVLMGNTIEVIQAQVSSTPGVDLIAVNTSPEQAESIIVAARRHFKLMSTPILIFTDADSLAAVNRRLGSKPMVFVVDKNAAADAITAAVQRATQSSFGAKLNDQQAQDYAVSALMILKKLQLQHGDTFNATEAESALTEALKDTREPVILGAGATLATFPSVEAQQALGQVAISGDVGVTLQVDLLRSLAASARMNGNQLSDIQIDRLIDLITKTPAGDLADAASEAYGALNLPTSRGVDLIVGGK
ncbi:MAG: hypothetical protein GC159_12110 [Phycisphaera sp.]|nr:hypothetical protein [Phycisphaera sp.]